MLSHAEWNMKTVKRNQFLCIEKETEIISESILVIHKISRGNPTSCDKLKVNL
jgi:hypothetical protein